MRNTGPLPPPKGCTNFKVRHLARLLSRQYDAELAPAGLKITQYALLKHVLDLGPIAPGELARRMGMDPSTLTRNLKPLVALGWLVQTPGRDARSRVISITPDGRDTVGAAKRHWKAAQVTLTARLGEQRLAALHDLLDTCSALLQGDSPPQADPAQPSRSAPDPAEALP